MLPPARDLDWEGSFNVRDLGGLPTADGRLTRRGAAVRADALDGVAPDDIAADYERSTDRLRARYAARGEEDESAALKSYLAERGTTAGEVVIAALQHRLVEP